MSPAECTSPGLAILLGLASTARPLLRPSTPTSTRRRGTRHYTRLPANGLFNQSSTNSPQDSHEPAWLTTMRIDPSEVFQRVLGELLLGETVKGDYHHLPPHVHALHTAHELHH
ncbi:hypothetical protein E2C01_038619 [Portunus trituberculatus]|uniref:Uncharacterized protein n=1 Tax=Portunus trituberculatus TaxID=210409 RepID=A0A5B7FHA1_PORTR|nr:hypothetical protein [Portunus trituberculatus]